MSDKFAGAGALDGSRPYRLRVPEASTGLFAPDIMVWRPGFVTYGCSIVESESIIYGLPDRFAAVGRNVVRDGKLVGWLIDP